MEARIHVGTSATLPARSVDGPERLGRSAVGGAIRCFGVAGHRTCTLDLSRADDRLAHCPTGKTGSEGLRARASGPHNRPHCFSVHCNGLFDLLFDLYADRDGPCSGRSRTLLRHCSTGNSYFHRRGLQRRLASCGARRDSDNRILTFRYFDLRGTSGGTLVDPVIVRASHAAYGGKLRIPCSSFRCFIMASRLAAGTARAKQTASAGISCCWVTFVS